MHFKLSLSLISTLAGEYWESISVCIPSQFYNNTPLPEGICVVVEQIVPQLLINLATEGGTSVGNTAGPLTLLYCLHPSCFLLMDFKNMHNTYN